jgi:hypothetical protein
MQHLLRGLVTYDDLMSQAHTGQWALLTVSEGDLLTEQQWEHVTHMVMTQYGFKAVVRRFGDHAWDAAAKELKQLHDRVAFTPQDPAKLTHEQRRRTLEAIITVKHKRADTVEGSMCADGRKQRGTMRKEETASPTVSTDSVFITAAMEATERRRTCVVDLPGAYLSADMDDEEEVLMVLRDNLAELMALAAPEVYRKHIAVTKDGRTVLYVKLCKALYGCLKSALLFYRKLWGDLRQQGFIMNPYDPCVVNKMIDGHQMTISWHVDDLKISHHTDAAITTVIRWIESIYGTLDASRGDKHQYLGMDLDYSEVGKVKISMEQFTRKAIDEFPEPLPKTAGTPADDNLFTVRDDDDPRRRPLDTKRVETFHRIVAMLLFLVVRPRHDCRTAVAFLATRVTDPDEDDWGKLRRLLRYLKRNPSLPLLLDADNLGLVH